MLPYAEELEVDKIHVQAPTAVVFVCGGQCSAVSERIPRSMRDAFLKILENPALRGREMILAEDITRLGLFSDHYGDVLRFETDLAQITELVLLFCESEGALAELGAFSVIDEIASKMLVIVRDQHWSEDSFVKLGPLRYLEREHGRTAVYVIDDADIGINGGSAAGIDLEILRDRLQEPLLLRLEKSREPTTFDSTRSGHVIKLIVGFIQEYGALCLEEIDDLLLRADVYRTSSEIAAYLLCAEAVGWIVRKRKGSVDLFFAKQLPDAATIVTKGRRQINDKVRRRLAIRDHWRNCDPARHNGIRESIGVASP